MVLDRIKRSPQRDDEALAERRLADIFDQAQLQRSKLYLSFEEHITSLANITGTLDRFTRHSLFVETTSFSSVSSRWYGSKVTCFFKIRDPGPKPRDSFHIFQATLLDSRPGPQGSILLELSVPTVLESGQRRKSIRVSPDLKKFQHIGVWRYGEGQGPNLRDPLAGMEHFKCGVAKLVDISAGGVRLALKKSLVKEKNLEVAKNQRFVMYLRFSEPLPKYPDEIWLVARVRFAATDFATGEVCLGMEFIGEGRADPETGKVAWRKVVEQSVEAMAQRTYVWHVDLYRSKGIT
ncbi:hypothetical protein [Desulfolutivibrio sulfoxidireducens]|uniref:hypothetical protein n=1 Tax=Desulfolutivibrio sulfoxidireducens TaxID=2773299 RepID=UPI00159D77D5|nr:hypothetical protein [Desulfolutivibrio sulfoxidireducens]QLA14649.1 hypothetical protein GD605_00030 [Desulfolutivibrio sulfoxidireducens]QLA18230.1 hypothetical protein GD604_00030 [Desulfolutivibrio sulfoxidireducens]